LLYQGQKASCIVLWGLHFHTGGLYPDERFGVYTLLTCLHPYNITLLLHACCSRQPTKNKNVGIWYAKKEVHSFTLSFVIVNI